MSHLIFSPHPGPPPVDIVTLGEGEGQFLLEDLPAIIGP